jgi:sec-independent protein translocase protein TatC
MQADSNEPGAMLKPFFQHLDDLRRALVWCAFALLAGMGLAAFIAPRVLALLKAPLKSVVADPDRFLRTLDITGGMSVAMQTILWGGLLFSAPVMVFSICWFVFPGLTRNERREVLGGLSFAVVLFCVGVGLCYGFALAPALTVMLWFNEWMGIPIEYVTITSYVGFVLKLLLSFGLTFELPIVILILGRLGLVTSAQLRSKRRHAIVVILILSMVITPTQDPFSQILLGGPLVALYEICIWLIWARECRNKDKPLSSASGQDAS